MWSIEYVSTMVLIQMKVNKPQCHESLRHQNMSMVYPPYLIFLGAFIVYFFLIFTINVPSGIICKTVDNAITLHKLQFL